MERKAQLKDEKIRAHVHHRHLDEELEGDAGFDPDSYLEYKQQKWEDKQARRHAKRAFKEEKHMRKYEEERQFWSHTDADLLDGATRPHYHDIVHSTPEHFEAEHDSHSFAQHHDYRYYKYQLALPEKERDTADR